MLCNNSLKILGLNLFVKAFTTSEVKDAVTRNNTNCGSAKYTRQIFQDIGQSAY